MSEGMRPQRLAEIYAQHHAHVLRVCESVLRNPDEAADAAQEVFAKLLVRPPDARELRPWLTQVARNHCVDRLRQAASRPAVPLAEGVRGDDHAAPEALAVTRGHLRAVLERLDARQRSALVRSAVLDQPLDRIASEMNISYGAAGQLLWRARQQAVRIAQTLGGVAGAVGARSLLRHRSDGTSPPRRGGGVLALLRGGSGSERFAPAIPAIVAVALLVAPCATPPRQAVQRPPHSVAQLPAETARSVNVPVAAPVRAPQARSTVRIAAAPAPAATAHPSPPPAPSPPPRKVGAQVQPVYVRTGGLFLPSLPLPPLP